MKAKKKVELRIKPLESKVTPSCFEVIQACQGAGLYQIGGWYDNGFCTDGYNTVYFDSWGNWNSYTYGSGQMGALAAVADY